MTLATTSVKTWAPVLATRWAPELAPGLDAAWAAAKGVA